MKGKLNNQFIRIAGFAVLVLVAAWVGYFFVKGMKEGFEGSSVTITYFYLPTCPHCVSFKPEWDKFATLASSQGWTAVEVNGETENEKAKKQGVTGYPTVFVTKNGKDTEYPGERKAEDLDKFVKSL